MVHPNHLRHNIYRYLPLDAGSLLSLIQIKIHWMFLILHLALPYFVVSSLVPPFLAQEDLCYF